MDKKLIAILAAIIAAILVAIVWVAGHHTAE